LQIGDSDMNGHIDLRKPYCPLTYPVIDDTRSIQPDASIHDFAKYKNKNILAGAMESFLCGLKVAKQEHETRGITWLELYILYRIRGFPKPIQDNVKNKAAPRANADKLIKAFTNQLRGNIARCCLPTTQEGLVGDGRLFKPAKARCDNLAGVGLTGKYAAINANIYVTAQEARQIAIALVQLSRTISCTNTREFVDTIRNLIPTELKLNGKANWDSTIPINAGGIQADLNWKIDCPQNNIGNANFFRCPKCTHVESSWCKQFQYTDLDVNIKCNKCRNNSKVAVWKCKCELYWHRCLSHREAAVAPKFLSTKLKTRKQIALTADNQKKARLTTQVGPDSHEWLLMQDLAKEKRKRDAVDEWDEQPMIILGCPTNKPLRPDLYGPSLKKRFLDAEFVPMK
jgi:hypothetical protein